MKRACAVYLSSQVVIAVIVGVIAMQRNWPRVHKSHGTSLHEVCTGRRSRRP